MGYDIEIIKNNESRLDDLDFDNIPFGNVFTDHMFVVDYTDGDWQKPKIQPFDSIGLHPATMALHYGQAICMRLPGWPLAGTPHHTLWSI